MSCCNCISAVVHSCRGVKPKITYWQTGICLDFNNLLLFVESAEPFLHRRHPDASDSCCTSFGDGVLVTVLTLAPPTSIDIDSYVLLSFATDRIESLITHWYPGKVICDLRVFLDAVIKITICCVKTIC